MKEGANYRGMGIANAKNVSEWDDEEVGVDWVGLARSGVGWSVERERASSRCVRGWTEREVEVEV